MNTRQLNLGKLGKRLRRRSASTFMARSLANCYISSSVKKGIYFLVLLLVSILRYLTRDRFCSGHIDTESLSPIVRLHIHSHQLICPVLDGRISSRSCTNNERREMLGSTWG